MSRTTTDSTLIGPEYRRADGPQRPPFPSARHVPARGSADLMARELHPPCDRPRFLHGVAATSLRAGPWALLLAVLAAAPPAAPRALAQPAAACAARTAPPRVEMVILDPEPRLSRDTTVAALHALSGQPQGAGSHHLGATVLKVEWRTEVQSLVATGPEGSCAVIARIRVTLANQDQRILIAREIPPGGCLYQEVEIHERRHVAVNRRVLREAAAPVRRALETWAAGAEARAPTPEAAREALRDGLQAAMAPLTAALQERRDAANRAIDTPEEYQRLTRTCALDGLRLQDRLRNP